MGAELTNLINFALNYFSLLFCQNPPFTAFLRHYKTQHKPKTSSESKKQPNLGSAEIRGG
jgi:hypothetical protein